MPMGALPNIYPELEHDFEEPLAEPELKLEARPDRARAPWFSPTLLWVRRSMRRWRRALASL
jgi:hypothetical protein